MALHLRNNSPIKIGIIGLGYVGLPVAVEFASKYEVVGYDINKKRINDLLLCNDVTNEVEHQKLKSAQRLSFSNNIFELQSCNVYIVTVPTPIDDFKQPDLKPLTSATSTLARILKKDDVVIYESTVFPGATEEVCVPILEKLSKLKFNHDFFVGYSPERINPGDKNRGLTDITKVVSGSTPDVSAFIEDLYGAIINAGVHRASSIKVAEAAKVIENTQRDINIALVNEFSLIFNKLGIDTLEVLEAAGTKWNFLPFRPGLVGGHCIGVDPYYLAHKAKSVGVNPELILAGRRINDTMAEFVSSSVVKHMAQKDINLRKAKILVMGLTFKENCPDLRNSKVFDLINDLKEYQMKVDVYDPWCDPDEALNEYGVELVKELTTGSYDAIIVAVAHNKFRSLGVQFLRKLCNENHIIYDLKYLFQKYEIDHRL